MLNESLRIMKATIGESIQSRKERKLLEQRQQQCVKDIIRGEFPKLIINEETTAEIIVKWCDKEKEPVQFFLKQLAIVGITAPVEVAYIGAENEYCLVLKENKDDKIWTLYLSKEPKEYLMKAIKIDETVYYAVKKIPYKVLDGMDMYRTILNVEKSNIKLRYCKQEKIWISVGEKLEIKLDEIDWQNQEKLELYPKAIKLIKELQEMDKEQGFYDCYAEIKEKLSKYFNLENVEITVSIAQVSISTRDGKIVDYKDTIQGVIIKNYNNWTYKEYCKGTEKVVFESDKIKIEGVKIDRIQEKVESAEKIIKGIEELEY